MKIGVVAGIFLFLAGVITFVSIIAWFSKELPNPNSIIERTIAESTKIYDRTGETILYEIHGSEDRTLVKLEELPEYVKWATIVIEDKEFYKHKGINLRGILRAIIKNILRGDLKGQGGSSITAQLVKNAILTPEKSYTRKLKEAILAYRIEKEFSKDEILQMYLNEIPYGSTAYGIEAAAQRYFAKSAKAVSIAEAAALAALPQRPTYFSPYGSHTDELLARQQKIVELMADKGYITEEQAESAKNEKLKFEKSKEDILAPHFVMYIRELITEEFGITEVEQGGLKITTSLDLYKQEKAEEAVRNGVANNEQYNASNAALVALDPKNGEILAMVGSKDYWDEEIDGNVNVVLRARQPGSSYKPIVYATAFENGYTPDTVLFDALTTFKTEIKDYAPHNYNNQEYGPVTVKEALAGSLNIPAVKMIYLVGINNVLDQAEKMGYSTLQDRSRFGLSLVLGGGEVKLLEHANAFAVFAREGEYHSPKPILKVEDKNGKALREYKTKTKKIISAETCRKINSILSDDGARSYVFGAGSKLTLGARPVAAKTGTTNDNRDGWTVGYTPSIVAGVWAGNNDNSEMIKNASGSRVAAPIWNEFMNAVLGDTPHETFKAPPENKAEKPILAGQKGVELIIKLNKATGLPASDDTPAELIEEKTYKEYHNILHWVNKDDDPGGEVPENPEEDPNYETWEEAVRRWVEENDLAKDEPPADFDELGSGENKLNVKIAYPENSKTITDKKITVQLNLDHEIVRATYYLDGNKLGSVSEEPHEYLLNTSDMIIGWHSLRVIVYDQEDNYGYDEINFNLLLPDDLPEVSWASPRQNSTFYQSNFPLVLTANITNLYNLQQLDVYFEDDENNKTLIRSITEFPSEQQQISWEAAPGPGDYTVLTVPTSKKGHIGNSELIIITIE